MIFRRKQKRQRVAYHTIGPDHKYLFDIVGERHRQQALRAIASHGRRYTIRKDGWDLLGVLFWLDRDPKNSYDPNAVGVWAGNEENQHVQVGFIPAQLAQVMAPRVEKPVPIRGMIVGTGNRYGVKLDRQQMDETGLSPWRTWLDDTAEQVVPGHDRAVSSLGRLEHIPDHPDGPNTVGVVLADGQVAGTIRASEKLWGPNVDTTAVTARIRKGKQTMVEGYLPHNAHDATGWECGPHCATVSESDGRHQATGRLLHLRFDIPTCDQARAGFREAKRRNSEKNDQQRVETEAGGDGLASAKGNTAESCEKTRRSRGENFWAIDVETANADYASICQVGVVRVVDGAVTDEYVTLVDPEDWFDPWNTTIHGITPQDVKGQPIMPAVLEWLRVNLDGAVLVSHMPFDRVALGRAAARYDLEPLSVTWLDSARIVRRAWPDQYSRRGYGLKNVADNLGIKFAHHDALEDARAAAQIVLQACAASSLTIDGWLERVRDSIYPGSSSGSYSSVSRTGDPGGDLFGETVVFTGRLGMVRREAADLAAAAGCDVRNAVTKKTTLLVVGLQNKAVLAGYDKSSKHRRAEELMARGADLRILSEDDFVELVAIR